MKILLASYLYYYGDKSAGYAPEYYDIGGSLADMGHAVLHVAYDKPAFMRSFENAARSFQPDLVLYNPAQNEMDWSLFAAMPFKKALLYSDDSWRRDIGLQWAQFADYVLTTTTDGATVYGDKHIPFQWGVRFSRWAQLKAVERDVNVMFLGMNHSNRAEMANKLVSAGLVPTFYGRGWQKPFNGDQMPDLLATARIGLNATADSTGQGRQFKARLFEVAASGAMLLTEYVEGLERYFDHGVDAVFFSTFDDMIEKALHYLGNPREREAIAARGRQRALTQHDYKLRFQPLVERVARDSA
jgi:hypothetical protein